MGGCVFFIYALLMISNQRGGTPPMSLEASILCCDVDDRSQWSDTYVAQQVADRMMYVCDPCAMTENDDESCRAVVVLPVRATPVNREVARSPQRTSRSDVSQ